MHPLLDDYLCKKYPKIFANRNKSMMETCMCWGFECGDGYFFLIEGLCNSIQFHVDHNATRIKKKTFKNRVKIVWDKLINNIVMNKIKLPIRWRYLYYDYEPIPQVVADQVKEKFGGLCFYYHGGDEIIDGMVRLAESLSYRICEDCGVMNEFVNQNSEGWIRSTCQNCSAPHLKENHTEHKRIELIEIWEKVRKDEMEQTIKQKENIEKESNNNDRSTETV